MAQRKSQPEQSLRSQPVAQPQVHTPRRLREDEASSEAASPPTSEPSSPVSPGSADDLPEDQQNTPSAEEQEAARIIAEQARQRQRRKLLHDCERLLLLDFNTLAMPGWPDHHALSLARRRRDSWILFLAILSAIVLAGMANLVPAVIAGVSFGLLVAVGAWGFPVIRHVFTSEPSYLELVVKRRQMLHRARKHVAHLEEPLGLAACCRHMAEYNSALRRHRFQRLYRLSEQGRLAGSIRSRAAAQLYLIFALEAEKAYNRLREAYLKNYQDQLEQGSAEPLDAAAEASGQSAELLGLSGSDDSAKEASEDTVASKAQSQPSEREDDVSRGGAS